MKCTKRRFLLIPECSLKLFIVEMSLWSGLMLGVISWILMFSLGLDLISEVPANEWSAEFQVAVKSRARMAMIVPTFASLTVFLCAFTLRKRLKR